MEVEEATLVTLEVVEVGVAEGAGIVVEGAATGAASELSTLSVVNVGVSLITEEMFETLTSTKSQNRLL